MLVVAAHLSLYAFNIHTAGSRESLLTVWTCNVGRQSGPLKVDKLHALP